MAKTRKTTTILCSECGETGVKGKDDICLTCYQNKYKAMKRLLARRNRVMRISEDA